MTEHLPECWAKDPSDPPAWCICDELRACEQRVHREISAETLAGFRYDYEQGAYDMRERAIEVIEGLKVEGDPYVIGSVALFHIRALEEKQ